MSRATREIGADPAFVIASTHDDRAILKPHLLPHEMDAAMEESEWSVHFYADAWFASASGLRFYAVALSRLGFRFPQVPARRWVTRLAP